MKSHGVEPSTPAPKSGLRSRGIGDLAGNLRVDGAVVPGKPIPASAGGVIAGMKSAAQDGMSAGAESEPVPNPVGSQRKNLPKAVQDLIAPPNYRVP